MIFIAKRRRRKDLKKKELEVKNSGVFEDVVHCSSCGDVIPPLDPALDLVIRGQNLYEGSKRECYYCGKIIYVASTVGKLGDRKGTGIYDHYLDLAYCFDCWIKFGL